MGLGKWLRSWPVYRQLTGDDPLGRGAAAESTFSAELTPKTATADRVVNSVCPYCAVGCAQKVYVKDERSSRSKATPVAPSPEADCVPRVRPANSWSQDHNGRNGSSTARPTPPNGRNSISTRPWTWWPTGCSTPANKGWQETDEHGRRLRRTMGIASLGGATLDNEENYLIKKLFTALGAVQIENQARI